jgi:hypothetical protein
MRHGLPNFYEEQEGRAERKCSSGRACAAPQEMENEQDQADDQQDVNEAGTNVKCEKAKQPENNQNQGNKSEHRFVSSNRGEEFRESCGSLSCDGRCPKAITREDFRRAGDGNLCSLKQFRSRQKSGWDFIDWHQVWRGYRGRLENAQF